MLLRVRTSLIPLAEVMSECPLNMELLRGPEGAWAQQDQWAFGGATRYQGCLLGDFKAEE